MRMDSDKILHGKIKNFSLKKLLIPVFFLLLTLFTLIALQVKYHGRGSVFTGRKSRIRSFDPVKVKRIELSWKDNKVTLIMEKDDLWHLAERNMTLASASRVGDLLHHFNTIRILKELDSPSPDVLQKLNLVENADAGNRVQPGIKAVLKDQEGKILFQILLGSGHYPPVSGDSPGTVMAKGRYILTGGKVYLAAQLFENCIPLPQVYVEPLAIRNMNTALLVMRTAVPEKEGAGTVTAKKTEKVLTPVWAAVRQRANMPFRLVFPEKKVLDMQQFANLSEVLAKQLTIDVLPDLSPEKLTLFSMMTIQLSDGFGYRLGMAKQGKDFLLLPQVTFDAGKIRRQAGESEKLHQARIAGAKLRFESEKRYYNGKVFRMVPGVMEKLSVLPFPAEKKPGEKGISSKGKKKPSSGKKPLSVKRKPGR